MTDQKEKLNVIEKSKDLFDRTLTLTTNRKKFPAKFRTLVNRMQNKSMDIYETLMDANSKKLYIPKEKEERIKLLSSVITYCNELNLYIEVSQNHNLISMESCEAWSKLCGDVKYMTISLRSADEKR